MFRIVRIDYLATVAQTYYRPCNDSNLLYHKTMASRNQIKTFNMDFGSSHHSRGGRKPGRLAPSSPRPLPSPPGGSPHRVSDNLDVALRAGHVACERAIELHRTSKLSQQGDLAQLNWEDIFLEDMLGVGGFASVCLVTCPKLRAKDGQSGKGFNDGASSVISFDPSWGSSYMSMDMDESEELGDCYALKCLSNRTMANPRQFVTGAADLVGEAFLLSRLSHPNIIQLHAVTAGNIAEAFTKKGGYFLVLEALETTLSSKLQKWRKDPLASMDDFLTRSRHGSLPSVEERLSIAMSIAKGMEYLHLKNVIFRDLKPDNVGFDEDGMVKLFDFGLARETPHDRLPGMAGSMLYLSPETILEKFNCKASDVYSFGILMWELVSLRRPYPEFHQPNQLQKAVAIDGHRPDPRVVTHPIKDLIESCWQMNYAARPTFTQVLRCLEELRDNGKPRRIKSAPTRH